MKLKLLGSICIAFTLAGCANYARHAQEYNQRIASERAAALMQRCSGYGFKPGTPDFSKCLMAADNNQRAIEASEDLADQQLNRQRTQDFIKCGDVFGCGK